MLQNMQQYMLQYTIHGSREFYHIYTYSFRIFRFMSGGSLEFLALAFLLGRGFVHGFVPQN